MLALDLQPPLILLGCDFVSHIPTVSHFIHHLLSLEPKIPLESSAGAESAPARHHRKQSPAKQWVNMADDDLRTAMYARRKKTRQISTSQHTTAHPPPKLRDALCVMWRTPRCFKDRYLQSEAVQLTVS
jgi:hypothetical protein